MKSNLLFIYLILLISYTAALITGNLPVEPESPASLSNINDVGAITDIAISPPHKGYILQTYTDSSVWARTTPLFGAEAWREVLKTEDKYTNIFVMGTHIVLLNADSLLIWDSVTEDKTEIPKARFKLAAADSLLRVAGKSLDQFWITYKKNNQIESRLVEFIGAPQGVLILYEDPKPYRCVATTYKTDDLWALNSNGKIMYKLDLFGKGKSITNISIEEDDTFQLNTSLNTIYAHNAEFIFGLGLTGMIYQWNSDEKQFFTIELPSGIPSSGYTHITSALYGPVYVVHTNGAVYTIPLKPAPAEHAQIQPPTKYDPIIETSPQADEPELGPKIENLISTIMSHRETPSQTQTTTTTQPSLQTPLAKQQVPTSSAPTRPTSATQPAIQAQPTSAVQLPVQTPQTLPAAQTDYKEIKAGLEEDPTYDIGFATGLIQGILANKQIGNILSQLRIIYDQGVKDGPKACVIDNVAEDIKKLYLQEAYKIPGEVIKSLLPK